MIDGSMARRFESKAVRSLKRSASIRTTVPEPIAAVLGLEFGDTLIWEVEPGSGRVSVVVGGGGSKDKKGPKSS